LLDKVRKSIETNNLLQAGDRVIVGFSGGIDSVCLLAVLNQLKMEYRLELWALYVNHALRPDENEQELQLLYSLGERFKIGVKEINIDIPGKLRQKQQSLQLLAREQRYRAFQQFYDEINATKIALAHHRDDQAETIMYRIIRGTGLDGLAGIPVSRDNKIIRPMLEISREEIREYVLSHGLNWVEDSSNQKLIYQRNRLRHQLIPQIESSYNPRFKEALFRLGAIAQEQRDFMEVLFNSDVLANISRDEQKVGIALKQFLSYHPYLQYYILKQMVAMLIPNLQLEFVKIMRLREKIRNENYSLDPFHIYKGVMVRVRDGILIIEKTDAAIRYNQQIYQIDTHLPNIFADINLLLRIEPAILPVQFDRISNDEIYIDASKVTLPLTIRFWRPGDHFQPLGLSGTQKLHDFFINQKIAKSQRHRIPLLINGDGRIVWVVGYRMSEEFKVVESTKEVWRITVETTDRD